MHVVPLSPRFSPFGGYLFLDALHLLAPAGYEAGNDYEDEEGAEAKPYADGPAPPAARPRS
jgi:hypothetical protein